MSLCVQGEYWLDPGYFYSIPTLLSDISYCALLYQCWLGNNTESNIKNLQTGLKTPTSWIKNFMGACLHILCEAILSHRICPECNSLFLRNPVYCSLFFKTYNSWRLDMEHYIWSRNVSPNKVFIAGI